MGRKIASFLLLVSLLFVFNGCTFKIVSVDKLLKPPMSDKELDNAVKDVFGSGAIMHSPIGTDENFDSTHSLTYNYADIDSDGNSEVITFVETDSKSEDIHMAVLKKIENKWAVIADVIGGGTTINSLVIKRFSEGVKDCQIITTWKYVDNMILSVYSLVKNEDNSYKLVSLCENKQYDNLKLFDADDDGYDEMLVCSYSSAILSKEAMPEAYVYKFTPNNSLTVLSHVELPKNCINLNCTIDTSYEATPFVLYFDAEESNGKYYSYVTYWDTLVSKLVLYSDGSKISYNPVSDEKPKSEKYISQNSISLVCKDINGDGLIDIPLSKKFKSSVSDSNPITFTTWAKIIFDEKKTCYFEKNGELRVYFDSNNYFLLPSWAKEDNFCVVKEERSSVWRLYYSSYSSFDSEDKSERYLIGSVCRISYVSLSTYLKSDYIQMGYSTNDSENYFVFNINSYGKNCGFKESNFVNIK